MLHVSASNPFRRWPRSSFVQLAATLAAADPARRIMITAGPSEADAADAMAADATRLAGAAAAAIVRCGEPTLEELEVIVARARLFIGGDSGPLHVAATTRVPIVALFGPTLPARSMPWRAPEIPAVALEPGPLACRPCHQRTCVHGDFRCLTRDHPGRGRRRGDPAAGAVDMSTATATLRVPAATTFTAGRIGWWALVAVVASLQLSIAAAQISLTHRGGRLADAARARTAGSPCRQ